MENKMFCFQCEQTAGCSGCTGKVGVCGNNADVAAQRRYRLCNLGCKDI